MRYLPFVFGIGLTVATVSLAVVTRADSDWRFQRRLRGWQWGVTTQWVRLTHPLPPLPPLSPQQQRDKHLIDAIHRQDTPGVVAALQAGANPNARGYWDPRGRWDDLRRQRVWEPAQNTEGPTALMLAIFADNDEDKLARIRSLLKAGADPNAICHGGDPGLSTPARVAQVYGRPGAAALLGKYPAR